MQHLTFKIVLTSDAEPGSGIGSELVNSFVTRDHEGRPCLRASHLKGLLRENLRELEFLHQWEGLSDRVAGEEGDDGSDGFPGKIRISNAVVNRKEVPIPTVTRTAVGDLGVVVGTSLRTVETIPVGSELVGILSIFAEPGSVIDLASRLGLLTISAVGGGRTRGAGACYVDVNGENCGPGALLKALAEAIRKDGVPPPEASPVSRAPRPLSGKTRWVQIHFRADSPVCCPETPTVGINTLRSGPVIPASAVIGALLNRLDAKDGALASACFTALETKTARLWPLSPVDSLSDPGMMKAVRVSLTHRMSKLPKDGEHEFRDNAIEPYDWRDVAAGSPLKANDGVLLKRGSDPVMLWPVKDMKRVLSTHGVHHDARGGRNLFTVESLAPMEYLGWGCLPEEAVITLQQLLKEDDKVALGRSRGVLGEGSLTLRDTTPDEITTGGALDGRLWVVQAPVVIPDEWEAGQPAETYLRRLAEEAGLEVENAGCWAKTGVRFGWNRHGKGEAAREGNRRIKARRCILPGSVLKLAKAPEDTAVWLRLGLGRGTEAGFGAMLPHPGLAEKLYRPMPDELPVIKSENDAAAIGLRLWDKAGSSGPSASQIATLANKALQGKADEWLQGQKERPTRVWNKWQLVFNDLMEILKDDKQTAGEALRTWQNLVIANREGGRK